MRQMVLLVRSRAVVNVENIKLWITRVGITLMVGILVYVLVAGMIQTFGLTKALWIAALAGTVIFLIAKNWKVVKEAGEKFATGLSYIFLFVHFTAMALGAIWVIVAIVHWAWRNS
jgi:hypothetical protein